MVGEVQKKKSAMVVTVTKDRDVPLEKIRNIGIIAHIDAGKGEGAAVKKRQDMERVAEANRAFAHFRW